MNTFTFRSFSYNIGIPVLPLNDILDYHDLTVCIRGKLVYIVDGERFELTDGDFIYIPPNAHRVRLESCECASYLSVNLFGAIEPVLPERFFPNASDKNTVRLFDWLQTAYTTRNYAKIVCLTEYLFCDLLEKRELRLTTPAVLKMKNYILQNLDKKLTVSEIAAQVFLSKEYCETLFKCETGKTIVSFINTEKINVAKNMLLSDGYKLCTIAEKLGFEDYNYFSRVFKKYTGYSPAFYRKMCNSNTISLP